MRSQPATNASLLTIAGGAVSVVLALSGACDRAIDQRITAVRQLSISERDGLSHRVEMLEEWRDRREHK